MPIATIITSIVQALAILQQHADIVQVIIDAANGGKLSHDEVLHAVKSAITAAYDAKVKVEMGLIKA